MEARHASIEGDGASKRRDADSIVRDPRHQYRFSLRAGDFLVYDNHRMLHARTGFTGSRWVRGIYLDS